MRVFYYLFGLAQVSWFPFQVKYHHLLINSSEFSFLPFCQLLWIDSNLQSSFDFVAPLYITIFFFLNWIRDYIYCITFSFRTFGLNAALRFLDFSNNLCTQSRAKIVHPLHSSQSMIPSYKVWLNHWLIWVAFNVVKKEKGYQFLVSNRAMEHTHIGRKYLRPFK